MRIFSLHAWNHWRCEDRWMDAKVWYRDAIGCVGLDDVRSLCRNRIECIGIF